MTRRITPSFAARTIICVASVALLCFTVFVPTWIEAVFGVDPDHGGGALEWAVALTTALAAIVSGAVARREWRKLAAAGASAE